MKQGQKIVREKRQCKGGRIMVWLMTLPIGLLSYHVMTGSFKAKDYKDILQNKVVKILKLNHHSDLWYQEDNCPVHKAGLIKDFMKEANANVLKWPTKSPDLNIVEDVWKHLTDKVYGS